MTDKPQDENEARNMLLNPYYTIVVAKSLSEDHETLIPEEDWVKANARLINEIGAEQWLNSLLKVLKGE